MVAALASLCCCCFCSATLRREVAPRWCDCNLLAAGFSSAATFSLAVRRCATSPRACCPRLCACTTHAARCSSSPGAPPAGSGRSPSGVAAPEPRVDPLREAACDSGRDSGRDPGREAGVELSRRDCCREAGRDTCREDGRDGSREGCRDDLREVRELCDGADLADRAEELPSPPLSAGGAAPDGAGEPRCRPAGELLRSDEGLAPASLSV